MFKYLILLSIKLLALMNNYYVDKLNLQKFQDFKIVCILKEEKNNETTLKKLLFSNLVDIYQNIVSDITNSCRKSKNPKKCVIAMLKFEYNRYITNFDDFDKDTQNFIIQNMFSILKNKNIDR
jgi:hypothetical protein